LLDHENHVSVFGAPAANCGSESVLGGNEGKINSVK